MNRGSLFPKNQQGIGLYLFILIIAFLLPIVLVMIKGSIQQNRYALRDRNIKTAREMAESINNDYMNSFTEDYHRDSFDQLYLVHNNPNYAGVGSAVSNLTPNRSSGTIRIQTVATYDKGGVLGLGHPLRAQKGVDALFFWSSDAMKFDYVWNQSVTVGNQISRSFIKNSLNATDTVYVGGDFDVGSLNLNLQGRWVVKGKFTDTIGVDKNNLIVYCTQANSPGFPGGSELNVFPSNMMVPNLFVLPPEGAGIPGDLSYYDVRRSTGVNVPWGQSVGIVLNNLDQYIITPLDGSGIPTGAPPTTINYFPTVQSATVPFILSVTGGDVYLGNSVVSRPITLSVAGGNVTVLDNVVYAGINNASATRSFALLSDGNIFLNKTSGATQTLMGFFGTTNGFFSIQGSLNIVVTGTLYGPIGAYSLLAGNTLNVNADAQLGRFPPPLYPRRTRVVMWDYVP